MPKGSEARTAARKEEIISACAALYQTLRFQDITIKEIGMATSFTRTSIYNYFRTKEEIFLALLQREYALWNASLRELRERHETLSRAAFAEALARSLQERETLLKIMSMNHYDMEENSRLERLIDFKSTYRQALEEVRLCLEHFFPAMSEQDKEDFLYAFFPFLFGVYPYAVVTEKQREAMARAQVPYVYKSIYTLVLAGTRKLLGI